MLNREEINVYVYPNIVKHSKKILRKLKKKHKFTTKKFFTLFYQPERFYLTVD